MKNNKLYLLLRKIDKPGLTRLRKYLVSPYFNNSATLSDLFELLVKPAKEGKEEPFTREEVWNAIYKKEPFDDIRYRKLYSDLLKLVEGFMAQEVYEKNPIQKAIYLLEAVKDRKAEGLNNSALKSAKTLIDQESEISPAYYFYKYQFEKQYHDLEQIDIKRDIKSNVDEIINNLDYFYLAEKLFYYTSLLSRQYVVSDEYKLLFIEEIVEHIKKYKYENIPPISIFYQIYLTQVETENEENYYKLRQMINTYIKSFPLKMAREVYVYALNYCVRKINQSKDQFLSDYLNLYKELVENKIILDQNEIAPWHYNNAVIAALRLKEFGWAEKFINEYKQFLASEFRENTYSFNIARLYYYKKEYDKVIQTLQNVEYEDMIYNLNSKSMLATIFYEKDEVETLLSFIDSFRTFLVRHKDIPERRKKSFAAFLKYIKALTRIMPGDKKEIEKLKNELIQTHQANEVASYAWLLEKIQELE